MSSNKTVVVVDYGMGNLRSVSQALLAVAHHTGHNVVVSGDPKVVARAERLVLPGQGAMRDCMGCLHESGLVDEIRSAAVTKPLFGVCVGMQMLLEHSQEGLLGGTAGLGLIAGDVVRFELQGRLQADGSRFKVPQMGWNQVAPIAHAGMVHPIWEGIAEGSYFYFVHSYYAQPASSQTISALTDYGAPFASALQQDYLFATQFHPEKSADAGLRLYRNFLAWNP
jgi:glutamine amidotransferase